MVERLAFPDADATFAAYLNTRADAERARYLVGGDLAGQQPPVWLPEMAADNKIDAGQTVGGSQVVVRRVGGAATANGLFDIAQLQVTIWVRVESEAAGAIGWLRDMCRTAPGSSGITRCVEVGGPTPLWDPATQMPRYFMTIEATYRPQTRP